MKTVIKFLTVLLFFSSIQISAQSEIEITFGDLPKYDIITSLIKYEPDNTTVLAGYSSIETNGGDDVLLIKVNETGEEVWRKKIGGANNDRAHEMLTLDDSYILAGDTKSLNNDTQGFYLLKLDSEGEILWEQSYNNIKYASCKYLAATSDGGYALLGSISELESLDDDWWMVKTDAQGNEEWDMTFSSDEFDQPRFVKSLTNGDLLIGGTLDLQRTLIRLAQDGSIIWQEQIENDNNPESFIDVVELVDGRLLVCGSTTYPSVTSYNADGTMNWDNTYFGPPSFPDFSAAIFNTVGDSITVFRQPTSGSQRYFTIDPDDGTLLQTLAFNHPQARMRVNDIFYTGTDFLFGGNVVNLQGLIVDDGPSLVSFTPANALDIIYAEDQPLLQENEYARRVVESSTGEFIILGREFDPVESSFLITRVNQQGEILEESSLPSEYTDQILDYAITSEDQQILLTHNYDDTLRLKGFDLNGNINWSTTLLGSVDFAFPLTATVVARIKMLSDNRFVILLNTNGGIRFDFFNFDGVLLDSYLHPGDLNDVLVLPDDSFITLEGNSVRKRNPTGAVQSTHFYNIGQSSPNYNSIAATATPDTYWLYGTFGVTENAQEVLVKVNEGAILEEEIFAENIGTESYRRVHVLPDEQLVLVSNAPISYNPFTGGGSYTLAEEKCLYKPNERAVFELRNAQGALVEQKYYAGVFANSLLNENNDLVICGSRFMTNSDDQLLVLTRPELLTDVQDTFAESLFYSQVVPNPGNASLRYNFRAQGSGFLEFQISNLAGQKFYQKNLNITSGTQSLIVQSADWPQGMYIIQAFIDGELLKVDKWVKGE